MTRISKLLRLRSQTSSQQSQAVSSERPAWDSPSGQQRVDVLAVSFKRPNLQSGSAHCGSLKRQYIYSVTDGSLQRSQKQSSHLGNVENGKFFSPGLLVASSFLFPWFCPLRCQQVGVTVPSASTAGSQCEHVHRRRAHSSEGPLGTQFTAEPVLRCTYPKKHANQNTLYYQLEHGGGTCLLALLRTQAFNLPCMLINMINIISLI